MGSLVEKSNYCQNKAVVQNCRRTGAVHKFVNKSAFVSHSVAFLRTPNKRLDALFSDKFMAFLRGKNCIHLGSIWLASAWQQILKPVKWHRKK